MASPEPMVFVSENLVFLKKAFLTLPTEPVVSKLRAIILAAKLRALFAPGGVVLVGRVIKVVLKSSGRCHCDSFR